MSRCHLIISGARVIDGTGASGFTADVAVEGERIAALGNLSDWTADERIDGAGLVLTPGFIDVHTHDDLAVLNTPDMTFKISQGVTTVIAGNCGISIAPFVSHGAFPPPFPLLGALEAYRFPTVAAYRRSFEAAPPALNLALLAGHSSLRVLAMGGDLGRAASEQEIQQMAEALELALRQGCMGLSSGLAYPPASAALTQEMITLARVLKDFPGALHTTHMRDEGDDVTESVEETAQIGREAGVRVVISHHKCAGPKNYGRSVETLKRIQEARRHQELTLDVYPYIASSTSLLPQYIRESEDILVTYSDPHPEQGGRRLEEIAKDWGCDIYKAAEALYPAGAVYFQMSEEDLTRILAFPPTMVGSDGLPGSGKPHPRLWGTFPRVLGRYVRDQKLLSLEQAIHKMTGLSAETFGLVDRGVIAEGAMADLVLFDPERVEDAATFADPEQPARGIEMVLVKGCEVWSKAGHSGARPGAFITH